MYSERISEEWKASRRFYSIIPNDTRKANFDKILEDSPDLVNELENLHPALYREWRHYRSIHYSCDEAASAAKFGSRANHFREEFLKFLKLYPNDFPFDQLIKLDGEILNEYRLKSSGYEHSYEEWIDYEMYKPRNFKCIPYESKTKTELFEEFKTFWHLDVDENNEPSPDFPNTRVFYEIYNAVLHFEETKEFFEYCEDSNYHSFDSYPIIEQYRIQQEFLRLSD